MPGLDSVLEQVRKISDSQPDRFVSLLIDESVRREICVIRSRVGRHMHVSEDPTDYELFMREYVRCKVLSHRIWKRFWVENTGEYAEVLFPMDLHSRARYLSRRALIARRAAKASLDVL